MSGKQLREACKAAGSLSTSGVLEDVRERLRCDKESKLRGRVHAELLKGAARGITESDVDAAVEEVHRIEKERERSAAFKAFWAGEDNWHLFGGIYEHWEPDGTGVIEMWVRGGRGFITISLEPVRTSL